MKISNKTGPRTLPWGTPSLTERRQKDSVECYMLAMRVEEVRKPCVELDLDAKCGQLGQQVVRDVRAL